MKSILASFSLILGLLSCGAHPSPTQSPGTSAPVADPSATMAIAPQFATAAPFSEGLAAVQVGDEKTGKWGFIDNTGTFVITPQFDSAYSFQDGVAAVYVGGAHGRWGFIDKSGAVVINPQFATVTSLGFSDGFAIVSTEGSGTGTTGIIDKSGHFTVPPIYDWINSFSEGLAIASHWQRVGKVTQYSEAIDHNGRRAFSTRLWDAESFRDGVAPASIITGAGFKWGFIRTDGTYLVPPIYDSVNAYSEGLAAVTKRLPNAPSKPEDFRKDVDSQSGYVDKKGILVIPLQFSLAGEFSDGLAWVRIGDLNSGKSGYIDSSGHYVIPLKFADAGSFAGGLASASIDDKKYGYIDKSGSFVIPPRFDSATEFIDGFASVTQKRAGEDKFGLIDTKGNVVVPIIYETVVWFAGGYAAVKINGKYGYIKRPQ